VHPAVAAPAVTASTIGGPRPARAHNRAEIDHGMLEREQRAANNEYEK